MLRWEKMAFDQQFSMSDIRGRACPNKLKFGTVVQDLRENLRTKFQPFLRE